MTKINVLIADDHYLFAKLLFLLLNTREDIQVIGIARDGYEVLQVLKTNKVDVILLDITMPNMDGMQTLKEVIKKYPSTRILIISSHVESWIIQKTLKSGASGYLTKTAEDSEVVDAIRTVYNGGNYCSRESLYSIMNFISSKNNNGNNNHTGCLTKREKEILSMITEEKSSPEIANTLNISHRTVETHRKNLMRKLGVKNTVGLMKAAINANLVEN